jgi:GH18 family chitinase
MVIRNILIGVWNNPLKEFKNNKDPDLKVLLAVGGQDYAIRKANEMLAKDESRQKFVISTTKLLRTHEFDGIDLNFEPSEALGPPSSPNQQLIEDKKKLTTLCKVKSSIFRWKNHDVLFTINRIFKKNMLKKLVEQVVHVYYCR